MTKRFVLARVGYFMPPLARPKTAAMSDLLDRVTLLEPEEMAGCVDRVEAMALELHAGELYPESEIVNRVLGTSIRLEEPRQLVGAAILTDLSVIAERVSARAGFKAAEFEAGLIWLDEILDRWSVSKKTIDRYRRRGLIARRVLDGHGRTRLAFTRSAVEGFEKQHSARLSRASRFRRVSTLEDEKIKRLAAKCHLRFGWSLNQSAKRIAERYELSHEGVRQILKRAEEGGEGVFGESGPPSAGDRAFAVRASRRGNPGSPEAVAARWGRTKASARRAYTQGRADLLRGLDLSGPVLPTFVRRDADEVILGVPAARSGLGGGGIETVEQLFAAARKRTPPVQASETARVVGLHFLRWSAANEIATLDPTTASGTVLDRVETTLRWASLLKVELMRLHLGLVLEVLESRAGMRLEELGFTELTRWWRCGLQAASVAVNGFDPSGQGRLAGRIGLGVDRSAAEFSRLDCTDEGNGRATRRIPKDAALRDWTLAIDPWQHWLGIDPRIRAVLEAPGGVSQRSRRVLALRYGLPEGAETQTPAAPPKTLDQVAAELSTARVHVARFEREAISDALACFRDTMHQ